MFEPECWGRDRESGRGTLPYFDPLAVWVIATVLHGDKRNATRLRKAFTDAVKTFSALQSRDGVGIRAAHYALITNPGFGIPIPVLDEIITKHPDVLDLAAAGREVLERALCIYKAQRLEDTTGVAVDVDDIRLGSGSKKSNDRHFKELVELMQRQGLAIPDVNTDEHHPRVGNVRIHMGWWQ
jgi:hypothetical protein